MEQEIQNDIRVHRFHWKRIFVFIALLISITLLIIYIYNKISKPSVVLALDLPQYGLVEVISDIIPFNTA
jgi:hypothetical protein